MTRWAMIGVPTSAGAHHAGQERAPAALRAAGLVSRLRAAGVDVVDTGDLPGANFVVDSLHPRSRNLDAVIRVAREVADAVSAQLSAGFRPLVVGGDCTITLGAVAGFRRQHPGVGLAYVDGEPDLGTPDDTVSSGIFDSMGIAHLLGRGAAELAGLDGPAPLLAPSRLALVGCDPREVTDAHRKLLASEDISYQEGAALKADPEAAAGQALGVLTAVDAPFVVHFDVDLVDSGELPLGNFPSYGSGVRLDEVVACLRVLTSHPACGGLVLTEVNPTYDADGSLLGQYVDGITQVLAA
jgi:arginase